MKKTTKTNNDFTMIEIMVVVVIIAILAAFAVPIYIDYVKSARAAEAKSVMSSISNAADMYFQTTGTIPTSVEDMVTSGQLTLKESTTKKWEFALKVNEIGGGEIVGTSTDQMAGGAGKEITYNRDEGRYTGYGTK